MNRTRTISIFTLASLGTAGVAALFATAGGGCAYENSGNPEAQVCATLAYYTQSCTASAGCEAATVRDCEKLSAALSAGTVNSLFQCGLDRTSCGDAGSALNSTCFVQQVPEQAYSEFQTKLASDFCTHCVSQNGPCPIDIYAMGDAAAVGPGTLALASDTTVQQIEATCIPHLPVDAGAAACSAAFYACATPIATSAFYFPAECLGDVTADAGVSSDAASGD